ncbi:MAG TPA: hypothetical protein VF316_03930 [Polyangiaceae bacterium]
MKLRSFKLRFRDGHVRIAPATGVDGRPFLGPGVDLHGEAALRAFELAEPMLAWLRAREPGIALRSLSVDLFRGRALVSFEDAHAVSGKPMVLRVDPPESGELVDAAAPLVGYLVLQATDALARRS